jgi:hypothetical protein
MQDIPPQLAVLLEQTIGGDAASLVTDYLGLAPSIPASVEFLEDMLYYLKERGGFRAFQKGVECETVVVDIRPRCPGANKGLDVSLTSYNEVGEFDPDDPDEYGDYDPNDPDEDNLNFAMPYTTNEHYPETVGGLKRALESTIEIQNRIRVVGFCQSCKTDCGTRNFRGVFQPLVQCCESCEAHFQPLVQFCESCEPHFQPLVEFS